MQYLVFIFAFITPAVLWPIEIFFPYPHIIEELAKALLIFFLLKSNSTFQKICGTVLIGFLFGLSENFLYLLNTTTTQTHLLRFIFTMPLHIITSVVILLPTLIDKRLIFLGVILAGLIHYFFNTSVVYIKF